MEKKIDRNLRELQLKLLEMLIVFDRVMKEEKIDYYLIGGSALGAIRHGGFIPWDDDIDIALKRKDFERMEKIISQRIPFNLKYCKIGENLIPNAPIGYLYDLSDLNLSIIDAPTIDIFAIDGVPNNKILKKIQKYTSYLYHFSIFKHPPINRRKKLRLLINVLLKLTPNFMFNIYKSLCKKLITLWDMDNCKYCANIYGMKGYEEEVMLSKYFGKAKHIKFENKEFPIPQKYHEYLTHLYGDYMKLPREEERNPKHKKNLNK